MPGITWSLQAGSALGLAPSYFVECLIYNAPDAAFQYSFQETYHSIVNWMVQNDLDRLICQNEQQWLFGPSPEQWSVEDAKASCE